ncbi:MAG: NAD(P)-dependent oxidoreductase [Candidatus Manganitrophus sp.]|nr:NAD(P)-dependent oxidoreductase [Candidatus Manganitrophus sp.]WDT71978.1 MAG: NAD(P)-dependent oxidoreductase [Candidatus Manganitrophus sp.]WDT80619.1 MAG: NAD(P)-dependent oxidoreductase [Candidatus Manganitrophus sp.]
MKIAFLGLGIMGSRMAERLIRAGFELTVWNRTPGKAEGLKKMGAKEATSPKEAAAEADTAITMLADPASVEQVLLKGGLLEGLKKGSLYIDMTTVSPETSRKLGAACAERGVAFLDAPVTGSKPAAAAGELLLMVGGDATVLERARPVLQPMSKKIVHMGAIGQGSLMKLVNNLSMAGAMATFFEGFTLGKRGGLSGEAILEVLTSGALASPLLRLKGEAVLKENFEPLFSLKHMAKDVHLAVEESERKEFEAPISRLLDGLFQEAQRRNFGEEDYAALIKVFGVTGEKK